MKTAPDFCAQSEQLPPDCFCIDFNPTENTRVLMQPPSMRMY